jgi:rhodanese-related sulfurtransferase
VIVDLRTAPERRVGTYRGAVFLPVPKPPVKIERLRKRLRDYFVGIPKDEPISVYCAKGVRASIAASLLKDLGFTNVTNLGAFSP